MLEESGKVKTRTQATYHRQIELDGRHYVWNGGNWYDAKTFLKPPQALIYKLNALLIPTLEQEDGNIQDVNQLLERAREAQGSLQDGRAEKLARRVLAMSPVNLGALAILSSCLRVRGLAQQALDATEAFKTMNYPPLLISRAAALRELGRWKEARKLVGACASY